MAVIIPNITTVWYASDGSVLAKDGTSLFRAQNNYANLLLVHIEDGMVENCITLCNFTTTKKTSYTSHWFYLTYQDIVQKDFDDGHGVRYFAQFSMRVPNIILANNKPSELVTNDVTVVQRHSDEFLGMYQNAGALKLLVPPTEELADSLAVAFAINYPDTGFYQVEYNSELGVYEWVKQDGDMDTHFTTKQYNVTQVQVQAGMGHPDEFPPISTSQYQLIMQLLSDLEYEIVGVELQEIEISNGDPATGFTEPLNKDITLWAKVIGNVED